MSLSEDVLPMPLIEYRCKIDDSRTCASHDGVGWLGIILPEAFSQISSDEDTIALIIHLDIMFHDGLFDLAMVMV